MTLTRLTTLFGALGIASAASISRGKEAKVNCTTGYTEYASVAHAPLSTGKYHLGYQRPPKECRTFVSEQVDKKIEDMKRVIKDPDLYRLFENSYPNTLDTTVKWLGNASDTGEELTFIITGDIDSMWIRDSASQIHSYLPFLEHKDDEFAALYRGLINLQARYLTEFPYCNAFQPPAESGLPPVYNDWNDRTTVFPVPDNNFVFQCKYELDSIASFFQVSSEYYKVTKDKSFFAKSESWLKAAQTAMDLIEEQTYATYSEDGSIVIAPYTFAAISDRATETLSNNGYGNPVQGGTGLVRSTFRPSDDASIYQLFVPANMMLAAKLEDTVPLVRSLSNQDNLARSMRKRAKAIRNGIKKHATSKDGYAFEVDGFGGFNSMDDAGVPSLLSAPYLGYTDRNDRDYQATRRKILSTENPYWMLGPVLTAVGSPHIGPGWSWPMATIMQIMTSDEDAEIKSCLQQLVSSTNGLGLCHESIFASDETKFTRPWFAWVNGLFGEMILDLEQRKPHILKASFQG